ncbi:MAG: hypothetical protein EBS23_01810 [Betaproteobacteria bacterium]|nr:hypothetical protein [Betaproteobacteria bacterium]
MAGKDKYGFRESFPRFFKPDTELKSKVGGGGVDADLLSEAHTYLEGLDTNVAPQIAAYLLALQAALDEARTAAATPTALPRLTKPIMNVKATSGMFGDMMLCRVSTLVLTFLEDIRTVDADILRIVDSYCKVAKILIHHGIRSETDPNGQALLVEIRQACNRYYARQSAR